MRITSKQGQWLGDIAVREAGSIEAVVEMAIKNNISITGKLPAGAELLKPAPVDRRVMNYYKINGIFPATSFEFARKPVIEIFTANGVFTVPGDVSVVEVFAVGGGGAGKEAYNIPGTRRNGGSGGQVITQTLQVTPGATYNIVIGAGGIRKTAYYKWSANPGENTSFGGMLTAFGGLGGYCEDQGSGREWPQPVVEYSATGGSHASPVWTGSDGEDGTLCPFDLSAFPDLDGKKFGAGGGAGAGGKGGETGGANGNVRNVGVFPATFYGSGGGGGTYYSQDASDGYQGILIIKY